jgi:hypothetical protein
MVSHQPYEYFNKYKHEDKEMANLIDVTKLDKIDIEFMIDFYLESVEVGTLEKSKEFELIVDKCSVPYTGKI